MADDLSKKDTADLSEAEAVALIEERSVESLKDYDPDNLANQGDRVVEGNDRGSLTMAEFDTQEAEPSLAASAEAAKKDTGYQSSPGSATTKSELDSSSATPSSSSSSGSAAPSDSSTSSSGSSTAATPAGPSSTGSSSATPSTSSASSSTPSTSK